MTADELRTLMAMCVWHAEAFESAPDALTYSAKSDTYRKAATAIESCTEMIAALEAFLAGKDAA